MRAAAPSLSASAGSELRPSGPIETLDRALTLLRSGPAARVAQGWLASVPLVVIALGLYYLETIEGVRSLRPLFAALIVLGLVLRAWLLSAVAESLVLSLRPALPLPEQAGGIARVASVAAVAAVGAWLWLWPLAWLAELSPFAIAALVPLLALRGGIAPSWLARARCAPEGGLRAWNLAAEDTASMRSALVFVELLLLGATLGLFANLYALTAFALLLSSSVFGFDVAFVSAFLSADNEFIVFAVLAQALILTEPLRAAVSACVFADARGRKDGADLHAAVDALLATQAAQTRGDHAAEEQRQRAAARLRAGGTLVLFAVLLGGPIAHAQVDDLPAVAESAQVRATAEQILARPEFAEFGRTDSQSLESWLTALLKRWFDDANEDDAASRELRVALPEVSPWVVMSLVLGLVAAAVGFALWDLRRRGQPLQLMAAQSAGLAEVVERSGAAALEDARALAAAGDFGAALRALYATTLATLDRTGLIRFDPAKTNGQYLRAMPESSARELFAAFTQIFDRSWYGRELTSRADFERSLELAERICEPADPAPPASGPA